ncbi:MAG: hypothetical protein K6G91_02315 [Kiritimatiellae bacterium]|nr:hypothetical protein [Kiritimatiellia bacterium]
MTYAVLLLAAVLATSGKDGATLAIESETKAVDPAKSVFLRVSLSVPRGRTAELPDLRDRAQGFSLAEEFAEKPVTAPDGTTTYVANWRLVPEPCAEMYRLRPFAVLVDGGRDSFVAGPVHFDPPPPREPVTGAMECDPKRDLPPLSWKLVGWAVAALAAAAAVLFGLWFAAKAVARKVKEHRMSPIERAWVELERLLRKGLPGRGRYKDFYVELTMVVRRYIQRRYGIEAPHLTTEEFLREAERLAASGGVSPAARERLGKFLESADLVKFAGVEATPEMADGATASAREYLKSDSASAAGQQQ